MRKRKMIKSLSTLQHHYARRISQEAGKLFQILMQDRIKIENGVRRKGAVLNHARSEARAHLDRIQEIVTEANNFLGVPPD